MGKVIFTSSLLNNYSTLEDLKNHFNINNINMLLCLLYETYEIATNNNNMLDKRLIKYGVFFSLI